MLRTLFSQGNLQYYGALHYIEEKYGRGALKEIKTKHYDSYGSPLNKFEFVDYLKRKGINATVESKNDMRDIVASIVGNNPNNVEEQAGYTKYIKENYGKVKWVDYHSQYTKGQELDEDKYRFYQKLFNIFDKFLNKLNAEYYSKNREDKNEN